MNDWISWLDQHQGSTMVLLTGVYVVATVWVCVLMRQSNRLAADSLRRSVEYQKETTRPFVIFDLVCEDGMIRAEVANVGSRPAYNVSIVCEPQLVRHEDHKNGGLPCALTSNVIHFLAPGRVIPDSCGASHQFLSANRDRVYQVRATYRDSEGNQYDERTELSVEFYRERLYSRPANPPNYGRSN